MDKLLNPTQNYTVVPNEVFDLEVSAAAKYLYIYLMSRPSKWTIRISNIASVCAVGHQKGYKLLAELKLAGVLSYNRSKDGGGTYTLHEITTSRKATSGKATSGISTDIVSKERAVSTELKPTVQNEFARLWSVWPMKKAKQPAFKSFCRLVKGKSDDEVIAFATMLIVDVTRRKAQEDSWQRDNGRYIPMMATYLNQERWTDTITPIANEGAGTLPARREDMEKIAVKRGIHKAGASPQHLADDTMYRAWLIEKLRAAA